MRFPSTDMMRVAALVVGDVMLDRYLEGRVSRISPEAPVPVVALQRQWSRPGGAGNVAASLAALGCQVTLAGAVGRDAAGAELRERLLESSVARIELLDSGGTDTICKTRILASGHQQMLRLDQDGQRAGFETVAADLARHVLPLVGAHQVVVLADYDKGILTPELLGQVIAECRRRGVPCLIDPKKPRFSVYTGATLLTPNVAEAERAHGGPLESAEAIGQAALNLRASLGLDYMVITRGADGMALARADGVALLPAVAREVADVTGAGDTVVSVLAACLAIHKDIEEACRLASVAAGIAVGKPGVYAVTAADLEHALGGGLSPKVVTWETARTRIEEARRDGRRIVFTNGCFDVLHAGHLSLLERAGRLGGMLVVGLNSDRSVRALKCPSRPVNAEDRRAVLLAGLQCVDLVVIFDQDTPEELVRYLQPDVLVKGGDYRPEDLAGGAFVKARGGEIVILPLVEGLSTTRILQKGGGS